MYIYIYTYICISLSLYIYIYISLYILICVQVVPSLASILDINIAIHKVYNHNANTNNIINHTNDTTTTTTNNNMTIDNINNNYYQAWFQYWSMMQSISRHHGIPKPPRPSKLNQIYADFAKSVSRQTQQASQNSKAKAWSCATFRRDAANKFGLCHPHLEILSFLRRNAATVNVDIICIYIYVCVCVYIYIYVCMCNIYIYIHMYAYPYNNCCAHVQTSLP